MLKNRENDFGNVCVHKQFILIKLKKCNRNPNKVRYFKWFYNTFSPCYVWGSLHLFCICYVY